MNQVHDDMLLVSIAALRDVVVDARREAGEREAGGHRQSAARVVQHHAAGAHRRGDLCSGDREGALS